jgi:hypothetical protein
MESDEDPGQYSPSDEEVLSASNQSLVTTDGDDDISSQSEPEQNANGLGQVVDASNIPPEMGSGLPEDLSSTLRKTRDEDREKGKAVCHQIVRLP